MPVSDRFRRSRRRLATATVSGALLGAVALGAPSSASAYENHFCQLVTLAPTGVCMAGDRHTLQYVQAHSIGSSERICAASYSSYWGARNSDWYCAYGFAQKSLGGDIQGVGAVRNGDPQWAVLYGVQVF